MNQFLARRWPLLVLILLPIIPLYRIFLGEVIGPFDQIATMAPWGKAPSGRAWDILQADGVLQFYTWRGLVFEGWSQFDPPFWNPYSLMGTPLMANSQSAALYPLHILAGVLQLPAGLAINLLAWFHLSWAGLGVYLLSQRWGASKEGAVFAGSAVVLSTFFLGWLPLASVGTTAAWIPWTLYFLSKCFCADSSKGKAAVGLAATCGMMVLGGHLQFTFYGFLALLVTGLVLLIQGLLDKTVKPAGVAGAVAGVALGLCLAAPQLLPALEYSKFSHRTGQASAEGYQGYVRNALAPWEAAGLVFPSLMGFPGQPSPAFDEKMPAFWPSYVRPGAAFSESAWGVGPLVLGLLAFASRKKLKSMAPALVLGAFGLLMAMGTPLNALFYFGVPGWSATGSPGRIVILLVLSLCVLAGILWPSGEDEEEPDPKKGWIGLAVAGLGALVLNNVLQGGLTSWVQGLDLKVLVSKQMVAGLPLAMVSLGLGAVALYLLGQKKGKEALAAGIACQVALGTAFWVPTGVPPFEKAAPSFERTAFVNRSWGFLETPKALYPPNTAAASRIREVGGYDSLLHRDTVAFLAEVNGGDSAPETNGNIMHIKPKVSIEKLIEAGVSKVVYPAGVEPIVDVSKPLRVEADGTTVVETGATRVQGGTLKSEGFSRKTVTVGDGVSLLLKDRMMPGWTAKGDGKDIPIKEGRWIEVDVPTGVKEIEFQYTPPGLVTGLGLCAGAFFVLVGLFLFSKANKKAEDERASSATPA